ncbi:MAG: hypothetical protein OXP68_07900 [Anaerolineaceae bacterium]|nr:hypothetical protein [Anaerolineaceae bacterium]MDE0329956.1 hypothetical protein [Anaerolineaceae bacterium]
MTVSNGYSGFLIKPTLRTRFYVDYDWWQRSQEDLRIYLLSHIQPVQRERLSKNSRNAWIDFIDPDTGEVFRMDELTFAIRQAALAPDFINPQTSLVDSVFRVFLANDNEPQNPLQLAELTGRSATTILKTFGSTRIYKGIRPWLPEETDAD